MENEIWFRQMNRFTLYVGTRGIYSRYVLVCVMTGGRGSLSVLACDTSIGGSWVRCPGLCLSFSEFMCKTTFCLSRALRRRNTSWWNLHKPTKRFNGVCKVSNQHWAPEGIMTQTFSFGGEACAQLCYVYWPRWWWWCVKTNIKTYNKSHCNLFIKLFLTRLD